MLTDSADQYTYVLVNGSIDEHGKRSFYAKKTFVTVTNIRDTDNRALSQYKRIY